MLTTTRTEQRDLENDQPQHDLKHRIQSRSARLKEIGVELKRELVGIDDIIDYVIESVRSWYVFPELLNRPIVICLWGLTGTGKTQLIRSLAKKLGMYDRFIEIQMDGFSNGQDSGSNTVSGMLSESAIHEGEPGILVLDEFQRYRTINSSGADLKVERYHDVWSLLSDGKLSPSLSVTGRIDYFLAGAEYDKEIANAEVKTSEKIKTFQLHPYEAKGIKRLLKLKEPLLEIMSWPPTTIQNRIIEFKRDSSKLETDYSKLLIFVSGNLDEMYQEIASSVSDCDTDANIFHEITKKLTSIDVKNALSRRFKPEQIARLGGNHLIYPSFNAVSYQTLIEMHCQTYIDEIKKHSGLQFHIDSKVISHIYSNCVFPTQGTRPLFSGIHKLISAPLMKATCWAIERGATAKEVIHLDLDATVDALSFDFRGHRIRIPVDFEIIRLRARPDSDLRALLAVHEAGHALVYGKLFQMAPQEIKINIASFEGGYVRYVSNKHSSYQNCLDSICVGLAGRAAEVTIFGSKAASIGASSDLKKATEQAAHFVRRYGFGESLSLIDVKMDLNQHINTDIQPTNQAIELILQEQTQRACALLEMHSAQLIAIVEQLMDLGQVSSEKFASLLKINTPSKEWVIESYENKLMVFKCQFKALQESVTSDTKEISYNSH